jgi:polysaccharide export outer membrane protein
MKKGILYLVTGLLLLSITGCTSIKDYLLFNETNITKPQAKKSVTIIKNTLFEYKIQPHDRLSITMYNHPELGTSSVQSQRQDTTGVLVNARGYVRLPLIKSIHVAGLTQTAAQKKIEKAFSAYLEDAEVYLEVLNKRAYILGEVKKPGAIPLFNEKLSLLQFLALSGDLTDFANRKSIVIMRQKANKIYTQTVDLTGKDSIKLASLMIYPNDIVYVAPNNMKAFNVGVDEISPSFALIRDIITPIANIKYLFN